MPARSVCLVTLSLSEAGPGRFGRQISVTDIYHTIPYRYQCSSLNLHPCGKITDTGLEHVAQLTQLTSLDLSCCDKITDTGLEHAVAQLTQLAQTYGHYIEYGMVWYGRGL